MPPLRIGIVGAGIMGDMHGRVFARQSDCQLAAVCDLALEKAQTLAGKLGAPAAFASCEAMRAATPLDVVSICTPDSVHAAPAASRASRWTARSASPASWRRSTAPSTPAGR